MNDFLNNEKSHLFKRNSYFIVQMIFLLFQSYDIQLDLLDVLITNASNYISE